MGATVKVKGKLAGPGQGVRTGGAQQSISFGRARPWVGGARWAGSSQLVAFEAFTAVGEGQPREVGCRPGAGRRKGPRVP